MSGGCHGDSGASGEDGDAVISQAEVLDLMASTTAIMNRAVNAVNGDASLRRIRGVAAALVAVKQSGVELAGVTFVLDPSRLPELAYVADPTRSGLAITRSRFALYDVDARFMPIQPLVESGFVEIGLANPVEVFLQGGTAATYSGSGSLSLVAPWDFARQMAAVLGGRTLESSGNLIHGSTVIPFSYADSIRISGLGDFIVDIRDVEITTPAGFMSFQSTTNSSIRFSDSDHEVQIRFETDVHDIVVEARWIRGNLPGLSSISIDGDDTLLTVDESCGLGTCYRIRGQALSSPVLDAFELALLDLETWSTSGYGPPGPLEALAAPILFGIAENRISQQGSAAPPSILLSPAESF